MNKGQIQATRAMRHLDELGRKYTDLVDDASSMIRMQFEGDNGYRVTVGVVFEDDGTSATFHVPSVARMPEGKRDAAILKCNELMNRYRWAALYVNKDNDVVLQIVAPIDDSNAGPVTDELVTRAAQMANLFYPEFMRVAWS